MAKITININGIQIEDVDSSDVLSVESTVGDCESVFTFTVTPVTSAWVEWLQVTTGGFNNVQKTSGDMVAVNGQVITEETTYELIMAGHHSENNMFNIVFNKLNFIVKDTESGTTLSMARNGRRSTEILCAVAFLP